MLLALPFSTIILTFAQMRLFVCLILILSASLAPCQSEVDSLRGLIQLSPADTNRMKLMLDLAYIYEFENRDSAIAIYERTFELANSLNNDLYRGRSIQYRSIVMHDMGKFAESIVGNNKALLYYGKIQYEKGIASTRNNIGNRLASVFYLHQHKRQLR